jgi:hypothetical protein
MKIRIGFCANSSSQSFCLLGISFDKDKIKKELQESYDSYAKKYNDFDFFNERGLTKIESEEDDVIVGIPVEQVFDSVSDNKTFKQIKDWVKEQINQIMDSDEQVDFWYGSSYDA